MRSFLFLLLAITGCTPINVHVSCKTLLYSIEVTLEPQTEQSHVATE